MTSRICFSFARIIFFLFVSIQAFAQKPVSVSDPAEWVNPLMGTDSKPSLSNGNTYPAIGLPWGMNYSSHPLAKAILTYADKLKISYVEPENFEVIKGRGVAARVDGRLVLFGNKSYMEESKISLPQTSENLTDTAIYLSIDNKLAGIFYISDAIREGAKGDVVSRG